MESQSGLADENPWWEDPGAIEKDRHVAAWERSGVRWPPAILGEFTLDKDAIYTLCGPRQIGKTTALKILARTLLGGGARPQNILYCPCDAYAEPRGLYDAVREYLRRGGRDEAGRTFILLDDATGCKNWQAAVKRLWDMGRLVGCTVIATGSNAADATRSAGRLAGRRGRLNEAMDKVMEPLSFPEYVAQAGGGLAGRIAGAAGDGGARGRHLDSLFSGSIPPELEALSSDLDALNRHLGDYAASGGLPWVIEQRRRHGAIPEDAYAACLDMLLGEVAALKRSREIVKGVAGSIVRALGRPVSWTSMAKGRGLPSGTTAMSYASMLEDMFVLSIVYQYDEESKTTVSGKSKKIHFSDPFYLHTLRGWTAGEEAHRASIEFLADDGNLGRVVEGIAASHLTRMAFRRSPKKAWFLRSNYVACWVHGPQREVDLVYTDGRVQVPIEVKFGRSPNKRDLDGVIAFRKRAGAGKGLVLTRSGMAAERECLKVPAALFLLLA